MANPKTNSGRSVDTKKQVFRFVSMALLACVMVGAVLMVVCSVRNERLQNKLSFDYNGSLQELTYPIREDAAAQKAKVKAIKRHGQTGKFRYYCEKILYMQAYYADSAIQFGNVSSNDCILVFYIYDENDALLYRSDGIEPGQRVHSIRLIDPKPAGTYACKLYVAAFDKQTYAYLGAQYSDLTLMIGG